MTISPLRILQILLLLGMVATGLYFYPLLPHTIPSHWNFAGEVDGTMPKEIGVWMMPLLALGLSLLLPLLQRLDPLRKNYDQFRSSWMGIQLIMVAFFAYTYALQLYATLHPENALLMNRGIFIGIGALFAGIGACLRNIRHNFFVGIRTPWTLANDETWRKTHTLASPLWIAAGLLIIVEGLLWIGPAWAIFIGTLLIATIVPVMYSYVVFRARAH